MTPQATAGRLATDNPPASPAGPLAEKSEAARGEAWRVGWQPAAVGVILLFVMLLTPHTIIGLAIAKAIPNPLVSAPLALASHFAADMVPHWDFFTNGQGATGWRRTAIWIDFLVGLVLGLAMMRQAWPDQLQTFNFALCAFMACLPDGLESPKMLFNKEWWIANKALAWQRFVHFRAQLPWGLLTQLVVATVALLLLLS